MGEFDYIRRNYENLLSDIRNYEDAYGRKITVVAVTKSGSDAELLALSALGAADIGENRPSELKRRYELLKLHGYTPRMHEIGNLQRNKVKLAIGCASLIHSVGKIELAEQISRQAQALGIAVPVLIEVNSGCEANKGGVLPSEAEALFLKVRELPSLKLSGLMTMGPVCKDPEDIRPYFRKTKELFDMLGGKHGYDGDGILSMGMSDSYKTAIEEGSTLVRVGRCLFNKFDQL